MMRGLKRTLLSSIWFRIFVVVVFLALVQLVGFAYQVLSSPAVIRHPQLEHYHFRMQIIVDGKAENFSQDSYQEDYSKDQCTADLPDHPFHFHDQKDQIVHVHWEGMTGGLVMKYYGWNYIGGPDSYLGYSTTDALKPKKITIHGKVLPHVSKKDSFYVYTGDEAKFTERTFTDWKSQDLENFFGVTSNFPAHKTNMGIQASLFQWAFPKAYAHGNEAHEATAIDANETEGERLTRINNLIGNVVIFVQKDKPTDQQVKDRFNHLEPLSDSTCGG